MKRNDVSKINCFNGRKREWSKDMKRVKEGGEGFGCERIDSSLNFSEIFRELVILYVSFLISRWKYSKCIRDIPAFARQLTVKRSKLSHKLKLEYCTTQSVIQLTCCCVCVCVCAVTYGCRSESNSASQYFVIFIEMLFTTFMFGTFL
jgi:hypothetical protein